MAFDTGIFIDRDDSNTIPDPTVMAMAAAIPLPFNVARFWSLCQTATDPYSNRKFDIYSRSRTTRDGTVGTGGWDDSATTSLPVTDSTGLTVGTILKVASEYVVVSAVSSSTAISVFARGFAGTTAAAHLADVAYTVVGSAINDTDLDSVTSMHESTGTWTNYMQTVAEIVDLTMGGRLDPRDGISSSMEQMLQMEAFNRVVSNIARSSILGKRAAAAATAPWATAGLLQQLTDTTGSRTVLTYSASSGVITETKLRAALRLVTNSGRPTDIVMSSSNKDKFNQFIGSVSSTNISMNTDMSNTVAGYFVDTYNYEGLYLKLHIDTDMPDDQIAIINANDCLKGWKRGDDLRYVEEPAASSREFKYSYNGSFFVEVRNVGTEHILINNITTS